MGFCPWSRSDLGPAYARIAEAFTSFPVPPEGPALGRCVSPSAVSQPSRGAPRPGNAIATGEHVPSRQQVREALVCASRKQQHPQLSKDTPWSNCAHMLQRDDKDRSLQPRPEATNLFSEWRHHCLIDHGHTHPVRGARRSSQQRLARICGRSTLASCAARDDKEPTRCARKDTDGVSLLTRAAAPWWLWTCGCLLGRATHAHPRFGAGSRSPHAEPPYRTDHIEGSPMASTTPLKLVTFGFLVGKIQSNLWQQHDVKYKVSTTMPQNWFISLTV